MKYAVSAGADAVYIGGKKFGARASAQNFSDDEIIEAIDYCHLYGVKVYVTVNTLIYDSEINDVINYIDFLHRNHIDAIIVQDIGLITLINKTFPNLEIHASTQMHNYSLNGILKLKDLKIKRVVLARELSIKEIKEISKHIDTEIFIHGSLCVSYSGQCLISALEYNRSGNRGECAQACRMQYELSDKKGYYLSPKDLKTIDHLEEILNSGVKSLKIEGRLKSKEYVYLVTKLYRIAIDSYYETGQIKIDNKILSDLAKEFNRSYTTGHLFDDKEIINNKRPNHSGIKIGEVINFNENKITIKLSDELNQEDGIKFEDIDNGFIVNKLYKNGKLVNSAQAGDIIELDNKISLNQKDIVLKTLDIKLKKELANIPEKKIDITAKVIAKLNEPLTLIFYKDDINITLTGEVLVPATKQPINREDIKTLISKLGNTPFNLKNIEINLEDNLFMPLKAINELRRNATEELIKKLKFRENNYKKEIPVFEPLTSIENTTSLNVSVKNEEQLLVSLKYADNIYIDNYGLYKKYENNSNIYYLENRLENEYDSKNIIINDISRIRENHNIIGNYHLNVTNAYSVYYLQKSGLSKATLSLEMNTEKIKELVFNYQQQFKSNPSIEIYIYGTPQVMLIKDNKLNIKDTALLKNRNKEYYVEFKNKTTNIYSSQCINNIKEIKKLNELGINNFRLDFNLENAKEIEKILITTKQIMESI